MHAGPLERVSEEGVGGAGKTSEIRQPGHSMYHAGPPLIDTLIVVRVRLIVNRVVVRSVEDLEQMHERLSKVSADPLLRDAKGNRELSDFVVVESFLATHTNWP